MFDEREENLFKKGILLYKEINTYLQEIISSVRKRIGDEKIKKFQIDFNYLVQYFLFNCSIPKGEERFSFAELLFIVDIGNLNERLDFSVENETKLVFLMIAEKKKSDIEDFKKALAKKIFNSKKIVLKIFDDFNRFQKNKYAAYDKIITSLAGVIEIFLNLEKKIKDKKFVLKVVKQTKEFFFNLKN